MKPSSGTPDLEWLHPARFANEAIYCDAPNQPDDVLYPGSDDEAYHSPSERRMRFETQAKRFLEGKPLFLLSASLRGPFDKKSGWTNPWRSSSASRPTPAQRRRPPTAKRIAAERHEPRRVLDSSSGHLPTPEIKAASHHANTPPRCMDDDTFSRVWDWRDGVLSEGRLPTSPAEHPSQTESGSADSRLATQQTIRSHAAVASNASDGGPGSSSALSDPPSTVEAPPCLQNEAEQAPSSSQATASQATASQNGPQSTPLRAAADLDAMERVDLSPHAVRIYEQSVLSRQASRYPSASQPTTGDPLVERTPGKRTLSQVGENHIDAEKAITPHAELPEASSTAPLKTHASSRTDGSFRYRRKDQQGKGLVLLRSKLFGSLYPSNDTGEGRSLGAGVALKSPSLQGQPTESSCEKKSLEAPMASTPGDTQEAVAAGIGVEGTPPAGSSQLELHRIMHSSDSQAAEQDRRDDQDPTATASQIDGPTLVSSGSSFLSEHSSIPSFGHFSSETLSQDIAESVGLPRRLLWPPSQRAKSALSVPAAMSEHTLKPQQQEPDEPNLCHSTSPIHSGPTEETTPVQRPPETQALATAQEDQSAISSQRSEKHMETEAGKPMENEAEDEGVLDKERARMGEGSESKVQDDVETASEAEDEGVPSTAQPQTETGTESDTQNHAEPGMRAHSPVLELRTQSPWARGDTAPLPPPVADLNPPRPSANADGTNTDLTQPTEATQSPWRNESDTVVAALGTPQHLPLSRPGNPKLSLIANQSLGQAAAQSPWARGDSQIPFPQPRLFNPLSSPAHSSVLPTVADAVPQPQQLSNDEDTDMCNSQLHPPHPSTPETERPGLPTLDFSLSVKSFRDFMTPSPQPATKRRRISTTGDHLPSTQALVDAAISNPWTNTLHPKTTNPKPRKQKRVSWALPDDDDDDDDDVQPAPTSPHGTNSPPPRQHQRPRRAASPPPSILTTTPLPTRNDKFVRHFAAVLASRRRRRSSSTGGRTPPPPRGPLRGGVVKAGTKKACLLPSASQRSCGSPALGAMAEAFLRADRGLGLGLVGGAGEMEGVVREDGGREEMEVEVEMEMEVETEMSMSMSMAVDRADERDEDEVMEERGDGDEEMGVGMGMGMPPVDDVSAVMQNLDDFLGSWDLDAELAKARVEMVRESQRTDHGMGAGMSGLMDVGVWD
ncbi:hypothetical protein BT67DRAFT_458828 [Trichocladium antarcticum]|uniref:Protamine P1 n=1 Tax=Trichocladium antarcticum TaxID=1450529 RepID=A0AAN6Z925_9PEZI|nr:hypothetical protein BT67DRAFT_458828 [Trichocladium antarcticum]